MYVDKSMFASLTFYLMEYSLSLISVALLRVKERDTIISARISDKIRTIIIKYINSVYFGLLHERFNCIIVITKSTVVL